jgi:hypothetical protein
MRLIRHSARLTVVKLPPNAAVPAWAEGGDFSSITRTPAELSIVCDIRSIPPDLPRPEPWIWLEVEGPLSFSLVGVLAALTVPLAEAGVSVFPIATHDTDHLLVRVRQESQAVEALTDAGHVIVNAEAPPL